MSNTSSDGRRPRDILSEFWSPVCAIGSHGASDPNAQVCVSVFGASVVPERPRLMVNIWKSNYTHGLIAESGSFAVTVLSEEQAELVPRLGMRSGHNGPKLDGLAFETDAFGNPVFVGGAGAISCEVIDAFDLGDATSFVAAVRGRSRDAGKTPLTRGCMNEQLGDEFARRWAAIAAERAPLYSAQMRWDD
jgi:flavin reductase (DIM6/NTAB) family NADH-FMN oxidoreductase RutF